MKQRQTKTLQEKYGLTSIKDDVYKLMENTTWEDRSDKEYFESLPHLGVFYIPYEPEFSSLIHERDNGDIITDEIELIKAKVIEVKDDKFIYMHYDDHHHDVCVLDDETNKWLIEGNIIKRNGLKES